MTTVVVSVVLTLAVQSTFLLVTKLPSQLHKSKGMLSKLRTREDSEFAIVQKINEEITAAVDGFDRWLEHFEVYGHRKDGEPIDRAYFRSVLPELSSTLGRLQGLSTSGNKTYPTDPLPDFIWLYEQARRISKSLIYFEKSVEVDFGFESSEFALFTSRVRARFEQLPHEMAIMQVDLRVELSQLEAEMIDIKTQTKVVGLFLLGSSFFLSKTLIETFSLNIGLGKSAPAVGLLSGVFTTVLVWIPVSKFFRTANDEQVTKTPETEQVKKLQG